MISTVGRETDTVRLEAKSVALLVWNTAPSHDSAGTESACKAAVLVTITQGRLPLVEYAARAVGEIPGSTAQSKVRLFVAGEL